MISKSEFFRFMRSMVKNSCFYYYLENKNKKTYTSGEGLEFWTSIIEIFMK